MTSQPHEGTSQVPWHPRITPYRLVVLSTTIGLGTAKAILTQSGRVVVPITLEWIAGTVFSLLVFSVSAYDSKDPKDVPPSLTWLFKPDCMDVFWNLLSSFSVRRPRYNSEEKPPESVRRPNQDAHISTIITAYRILVCSIVALFGISEAMLGYSGSSTAMTWMEWALAVPITTLLYFLGLYEYSSSNVWSSFFVDDRSEIMHSSILHTILISLSALWTFAFTHFFRQISYSPSWIIELWTDKETFSIKLMGQDLMLAGIAVGAVSFVLLLRLALKDITQRGGLVRRALRMIRRVVFKALSWMLPFLPRALTRGRVRNREYTQDSGEHDAALATPDAIAPFPRHYDRSTENSLAVFIHISVHLFFIVFFVAIATMGFIPAYEGDLEYPTETSSGIFRLGIPYMLKGIGSFFINVMRFMANLIWFMAAASVAGSMILTFGRRNQFVESFVHLL